MGQVPSDICRTSPCSRLWANMRKQLHIIPSWAFLRADGGYCFILERQAAVAKWRLAALANKARNIRGHDASAIQHWIISCIECGLDVLCVPAVLHEQAVAFQRTAQRDLHLKLEASRLA